MSEVRKNAMNFEAVKASMSQNKEGVILRLSVHPNDCPPDLYRPVGYCVETQTFNPILVLTERMLLWTK